VALWERLPATVWAIRVGLTIGFCGGFTTFSTVAHETVALARAGDLPSAIGYITISLVLGVAGMVGGLATGTALSRRRRSAASHPLSSIAPAAREAEDGQ
jgi:fluoride ion exporter CrcB/FEX